MKGFLKLVLALMLTLSAVGCSSSAKSTTITKTAKGFGGDVVVTVTLTGDKITEVTAQGDNETTGIGSNAIEQLPGKIVEANSVDVDGVSGATVTSNAIKSAVKAALAEASGEDASTLSFTAGTYTGEAYGNTSTIIVEVTVSETAIEKIEVVTQNETPVLFDAARDGVIEQILDGQTLAVDTITGVTASSNGVIAAVTDALESSGADLTPLKIAPEKETITPEHIEKTADVVVVGGGGAGLAAAITAAENGASVIVIEKAPFLGGNLTVMGGIYNTPDKDLQSQVEMSDSAKALVESAINAEPKNDVHAASIAEVKKDYEEWKNAGSVGLFDSPAWFALQTWNSGDQIANKALVDTMAEGAYESYLWLLDLGVEFSDKITQGAGSLYQRTHGTIKPNGTGFITVYTDVLATYDTVEILTETAGTALVQDENGRVVAVEAKDTDGNTYTVSANKGVVLSTGGFAGNVELRQKYCEGETWEDLGPNVGTTNLVTVTGDGIIMASEIGANLVDMEQLQLLHLGNTINGSTKGVVPYKGRNSDEVIFVNAEGERFVAEDQRRDVMCNAVLKQTGAFYWMIHDSKNIDPDSVTVQEYIKGGYMIKADTVEELAEQMGVDPATLQATLDQYNHAVETGVDELTGRTLLVATIDEGPYFAAKRVPSAHHTMGGVEINTDTHVLDTNGNWIEGLYAAGEVCGGIHGGNRVGGNAVDDTVVFGRIAGANAALGK